MTTKLQAQDWILDSDGSCRDVTFTPTTRDAASEFIKWLASRYQISSSNDNNGLDRSHQLATANPFVGINGYIHIVLENGPGIIPTLQLFVDHDRETDEHCIEVTFYPQDINRDLFSLESFLELVNLWNAILKSDDFFIRYENASWELYDTAGLGVICTRRSPPAG